jgi:hypothetical protein
MSQVRTYEIRDTGGTVIVPQRGSVIDMKYYRWDQRTTFYYGYGQSEYESYASQANVHPLALRLDNVSSPDNIIICEWMLSGEEGSTSNFGCRILRNGSIIPTDFGGGTTDAYGMQWQLFANWGFDGDNNSTPHSTRILYVGKAGFTGVLEYQLWFGDGGNNQNNIYYTNRTVGSAGQDGFEVGTCGGFIYEISGDVSAGGGG